MQSQPINLFGDLPTKTCLICHETKPSEEFATRKLRLRSGEVRCYTVRWCKLCMKEYARKDSAKNKHHRRAWYDLKRFGLTVEARAAILAKQGGVCAICKNPETKIDFRTGLPHALSVDHDHDGKTTRGLLCNNCNRGIGLFRDNPEILRAAIAYLAEYGKS